MNGLKKRRGIEKPKKRAGPIEEVMVKTELELVEVEKASLFPHKYSIHFVLIVKCPRIT